MAEARRQVQDVHPGACRWSVVKRQARFGSVPDGWKAMLEVKKRGYYQTYSNVHYLQAYILDSTMLKANL